MANNEIAENDWRNTCSSGTGHFQRAAHLLKTGLWSDVTFKVGEEEKAKKEFKAHKFVLRIGSKIFEDLFNEDEDKVLFTVNDLHPEVFDHLLKFLYTGETPGNIEEALPLLNAASKYQISDLVRICGEHLGETLTKDNALKIYQQSLKYGDKDLEERALKCISSFGYQVLKSPDFLEITAEELAGILIRDDLQVPDEATLFEAVLEWGRAECKRQEVLETHKYLRSMLEKVIPLIRFPQMDPTDFGLKVVPTNILLTEEVMSVLVYFSVKESRRSAVPTGIFNSKPRMAYIPRGETFVLSRLIPRTNIYVTNLSTGASTGYFYIPTSNTEHSIRLRSSEPIWLASLGMNQTCASVAGSCHDPVNIKIQLKDDRKTVLNTKTETVNGVRARTNSVYHVTFDQPYLLRPDEWYSVSFTVTSGNFFGDNYTAEDGAGNSLDFKLPNGSEEVVKFEFGNDDNLLYTGVNQGFIPEIGFMVD